MITHLQLIRNVGKFDSVVSGAVLPLRRLSLIYAENGRGKTTLSAILRSLSSGAALPIVERRRLSARHDPHVVINTSDAPSPVVYQAGAWSRTLPAVTVFDDAFVNENVYSGLDVQSSHRQNLHELILGAQGVRLNTALQGLIQTIEQHNGALRSKGAAIPASVRGPFNVEEFCALPARPDIDVEILAAERSLAAAGDHDAVVQGAVMPQLVLPAVDIPGIENTMAAGLASLDSEAASRVRQHVAALSPDGERWIAGGLKYVPIDRASSPCPFCAQDLGGSVVFTHYRAYFGEGYQRLKRQVDATLSRVREDHGERAQVAFERSLRLLGERLAFWSRFADVPTVQLDGDAIVRDWRLARDAIEGELLRKQAAPLDEMALAEATRDHLARFDEHLAALTELNRRIEAANASILVVKQRTAFSNQLTLAGDVTRLRATRNRQAAEWAAPCVDYLAEAAAKAAAEQQRDTARRALDHYRTAVFPAYQTSINVYLERFNTGFRIDQVAPVNARGGPSCKYSVVIDAVAVPVASGEPNPGEPGFRNTLSAGDRNSLALAFFFASLDRAADLASSIVVIDDPVSSLDDHRTLTTVQEIRRLATRAQQVVVLSHSKGFLARVWQGADTTTISAIQIVRDGQGSAIAGWPVDEDSATEHDRRFAQFRQYVDHGRGDPGEVARAIRPHLEAFLRVATPEYFRPGSLLGPFRALCDERRGTADEILDGDAITELGNLTEYANRFHHDTNPAWESVTINDVELTGYVTRALQFARR